MTLIRDLIPIPDQGNPIAGRQGCQRLRVGHQLPVAHDGNYRGARACAHVRLRQCLALERVARRQSHPGDLDALDRVDEIVQQPVLLGVNGPMTIPASM